VLGCLARNGPSGVSRARRAATGSFVSAREGSTVQRQAPVARPRKPKSVEDWNRRQHTAAELQADIVLEVSCREYGRGASSARGNNAVLRTVTSHRSNSNVTPPRLNSLFTTNTHIFGRTA
jgi:hypothetical protein